QAASKDEIEEGLHALWPYTRHITRDDWLEVLPRSLDSIASATPLRHDAQESIERLTRRTPEEEEEAKKAAERMDEFGEAAQEDVEFHWERSSAAADVTASLPPTSRAKGMGGQSEQQLRPDDGPHDAEQTDPLALSLPPLKSHDYNGFWYADSSS